MSAPAMTKPPQVLIFRCDDYDPVRIGQIVRDGLEELGLRPKGRVMLKPNAVIAQREMFPHAFTRAEVLDGTLSAIRELSPEIEELSVGERSGITIPTRFCFREAGYNEVIKKHRAKTAYFDESPHRTVPLSHPDRLRDEIFVPRPVTETDFLINMPKFKAHPWTRMTLSLKNFIGLQDDRHRLVDHNAFLEHKIVDLQEVIRSSLIIVDAITAGQKMMLTPTPFHLGAIVMGTNPCAVDAVCCAMVNLEPATVIHLKMASERGMGPIDLSEIEIGGDFPLAEVQQRSTGFEFCLERIDEYFDPHGPLRCTVGSFPEKHSPDYCWGGCPGALQEAIHIFQSYQPDFWEKLGKVRFVVGRIEGDLDLEPDERAVFAGDCTSFNGRLNGRPVKIEPTYRTTGLVDINHTRTGDMLVKITTSLLRCLKGMGKPYVHAPGCPVSVAEQVNYLSFLGKVGNLNFDLRTMPSIIRLYLTMRTARVVNMVKG